MQMDTMYNEEIYMRMLIAHYMHFRAAVQQNDGYQRRLQYGFMNNKTRVQEERFGRTDDELQDMIAVIEDIVDTAIKNGRPRGQPSPSPSYSNPIAL